MPVPAKHPPSDNASNEVPLRFRYLRVEVVGNAPVPTNPLNPAVVHALLALEAKRRAGEFEGPISCNVIALVFDAVVAELLR